MQEASIYWVNLPPPPSHSAEDRATRADSGDRPGEHAGLRTALHHRTALRMGQAGRARWPAHRPPHTLCHRWAEAP